MALRVLEGKPLAAKMLVIGLIILGLMIPLSLLRGLIVERSQMRRQAIDTVAKGWGGSLTVGGAMLRVPFDIERKSNSGAISVESHLRHRCNGQHPVGHDHLGRPDSGVRPAVYVGAVGELRTVDRRHRVVRRARDDHAGNPQIALGYRKQAARLEGGDTVTIVRPAATGGWGFNRPY